MPCRGQGWSHGKSAAREQMPKLLLYSGQAVMHSARDLQTRLRIDLAIHIGSAIEHVPHAPAQVTADRRPGAGPGLL